MNDINKQFYNYLWAYVLVALSGCLGNVVDGIIVGNLISADGVSAISLSKPINQFIFTLHLLINAGAGMLVGYALGQKDISLARRYFSLSLSLSVGLGILLALFCGVFFIDETSRMLFGAQLCAGAASGQSGLHPDVGTIHDGRCRWAASSGVGSRHHRQRTESLPRHRIHPVARLGHHGVVGSHRGRTSGRHSHPAYALAEA